MIMISILNRFAFCLLQPFKVTSDGDRLMTLSQLISLIISIILYAHTSFDTTDGTDEKKKSTEKFCMHTKKNTKDT
jgi:hypothetical protein